MTDADFNVQPNSFHPDPPNTEKGIEIDADGRISLRVDANESTVTAWALAECKNNAQPIAFFVRSQPSRRMNSERIRYTGFPSFSMDQETKIQVPLRELLNMEHRHHYCRVKEVATQFCGFTRDDKKVWKTEPLGNYTKSFSDLALVAASNPAGSFDLRAPSIRNVYLKMPRYARHGGTSG